MPPNTETLIPDLLSQYVHSRRDDVSLPDATALPFVVAPFNGEQTFPRVVFVTESTASPHPKRLALSVAMELQTSATDQDIETENAWTAGLRFLVADVEAFQTWLQALDTETRTGWQIRKYRVDNSPSTMGIDDQARVRARKTEILIHVRTDELAP